MRTTITLDDRLFMQIKRRAAETGTSVSRVVEQAVRMLMTTPTPESDAEPFELITFGAGGRFSHHNVDRTSALLEIDDVERHARPE